MNESVESDPAGGQFTWTHVLTDFTPVDELSTPLRRSARLKYTCIAVSRRYIALGANTGAVYIFGRETLKHLQVVLADKDSSPVNQVCFGPLDNRLAYSYSNGNVVVVELNIERRGKPERIRLSTEHINNVVTALQWDTIGGRLFSGDNFGKVTVAFIPASKAKDLFQTPSEVIARVDSAVVQLDWSVDRLLVSTVTRCYLCYTARQQYGQIGKKLRDGKFGACFYPGRDGQQPTIYCARPGSRIWEVDFGGTVLNTHQFKQLLAIPSLPVIEISDKEIEFPDRLKGGKAQTLAFPQLTVISDTFLFSWTQTGLYVLDPVDVKVITWVQHLSEITEVKCYKNEVYLFSGTTGHVRKLQLFPLARCVSVLVSKEHWSIAGQLCGYFTQALIDTRPVRYLYHNSLAKLYEQLLTLTLKELADKVKVILDAFPSQESQDAQNEIVRLNSGIYQVNDGRRLDSDEESSLTPSSSQSLSRQSSTSSLQTYLNDNALTSPPVNKLPEESAFLIPNKTDATKTINQIDVETDNFNNAQNKAISESFDLIHGQSVDSSKTTTAIFETENENRDVAEIGNDHKVYGSGKPSGNIQPLTKSEANDENSTATNNYDNSDSVQITTASRRNSEGGRNVGAELNDDISMSTEGSTDSRRHSLGGTEIEHIRTGSISSLSSISSNELILEPVVAEPVITPKDGVKKSPKKKKASTPVILGPGEKLQSRGPVKRSMSTGSSRKQNVRHRAKSDIGPVSAIQEVFVEHENTPSDGQASSSYTAPAISVVSASQLSFLGPTSVTGSQLSIPESSPITASELIGPASSSITASPITAGPLSKRPSSPNPLRPSSPVTLRAASPLLRRSSSPNPVRLDSPVNSTESSPFGSPLVSSWESSGITGPKTALRSVKDSLSSKIFSTKKNLMRTIREKRNLFGSRETLNGGEYTDDQNERTMLRKGTPVKDARSNDVEGGAKPEIDLFVLRQVTQITKQSLNYTSTLLSPQPVLIDWLRTLHSTLHQLRKVHLEKLLLQRAEQEKDSVFLSQEATEDQARTNIDTDGQDNRLEAQNSQVNEITDNSTTKTGNNEQSMSMRNANEQIEIIKNDNETNDQSKAKIDNNREIRDNVDSFPEAEKSDKEMVPESDIPNLFGSNNIRDDDSSRTTHHEVAKEGNLQEALLTDIETQSEIVVNSERESRAAVKDNLPETNIPQGGNKTDHIGPSDNSKSSSDLEQSLVPDSASLGSVVEGETAFCLEAETTPFTDQDVTGSNIENKNVKESSNDISNEIDWIRLCYITDQFHAGPELSADISYLVDISFCLGLHGHLSMYINPEVDIEVPGSFTDGQSANVNIVTKNGQNSNKSFNPTVMEQNSLNKDASDKLNAMKVHEPFAEKTNSTAANADLSFLGKSCVSDDKELALFVRCYFPYLSLKRIRDLLSTSEHHGYSTWLALIQCFKGLVEKDSVSIKLSENNVNGAFDLLRSGIIQNRYSVLGHLPRLLELSAKKTVEYCVEDTSYISPLDVLYMCELVKKPLDEAFYPYMLARYNTTSQPGHLRELCCNRSVRRTWLQGLLSHTDVKVTKTCTGQPLPGSHLQPWIHSKIITALIDTFLKEESSFFLQVSLEYGYWLGCLKVYEHTQNRQEGITMVVRLRDITLLASTAWSPVCIEEWETVLTIMVEQTEGYTGCSPLDKEGIESTGNSFKHLVTLNWNNVALLLVQSIGPQKAIELLQNIALPDDSISQEFYQALIVATIGTKHKRSLLHNILEKTDTYLWAKKPTQIAPHLHYAVEEERKIVSAGREGKQTQVFKDMFTQLESQSDLVTHRFVEDLECHWGVRCDLNRVCPCCGLQLSAPVSHSQPGVIVFHCGHGYHKFCHQDKVCQECAANFDNNLEF